MQNLPTMIQSHLYAKKAETPLYEKRGDNNQLLGMLNLGNWVGVLENEEGWYHVLTIQGDGWVRVEDVEERSPMNLQVRWEPGKPIEYVNAA